MNLFYVFSVLFFGVDRGTAKYNSCLLQTEKLTSRNVLVM